MPYLPTSHHTHWAHICVSPKRCEKKVASKNLPPKYKAKESQSCPLLLKIWAEVILSCEDILLLSDFPLVLTMPPFVLTVKLQLTLLVWSNFGCFSFSANTMV